MRRQRVRPRSSPPRATIRPRQALRGSTYTGSFSVTNAWSGVLVADRRTCRSRGWARRTSAIDGYGTVRRQKVYRPRRYRSSPVLVAQVRWPLNAACQSPAAAAGRPTARLLAAQQAAEGQRLVADHLGLQPKPRAARQQRLRGSCASISGGHSRRLAVGRRRDDQPQQRLDVPAASHELDGQPVEQFRVGRGVALRAEVLLGLDQPDAEQLRPKRLTVTRAVSGLSGSTSHRARPRRFNSAPAGIG